jgi:hypothetical protein
MPMPLQVPTSTASSYQHTVRRQLTLSTASYQLTEDKKIFFAVVGILF